jgi:hypothetical protein
VFGAQKKFFGHADGGRGVLMLETKDVSLTGEAGSDVEASRNILNVFRRIDRCICFTDDYETRGVVRDVVL